jgi:hypothetical protein
MSETNQPTLPKPDTHASSETLSEEGTMELSTEILIMIGIMLLSIIGGNFLRK